MPKLEDVVIRMQQNSNNMSKFTQIEWLFPKQIVWEEWLQQRADIPFSQGVIEYLNALSASLLKDTQSRMYPDVVTFAFFCRKANLLKLSEEYKNNELRLGRGMIFHIAPSNVPINFAYSLVAGLLTGNFNVVRVSSKQFPQVDLVIKHIANIAESYAEVSSRIALVRYEHTSNANDIFSAESNVRMIWGGDNTILTLRQSRTPARSFDVCFADRYSMAVINANAMVSETNIRSIAEKFYNDTYLFDQNACSAPHLVVWLGSEENIAKAKEIFWTEVQQLVDAKYALQDVLAVDKLTAFYRQAVKMDIRKVNYANNALQRVELSTLDNEIDDYRCAGGYFTEYTAQTLNEINPIIKNKYQTLAYYGLTESEINDFVINNRIVGFDRIVPFGETTSFSLTWDGYNLVNTLTRVVSVK